MIALGVSSPTSRLGLLLLLLAASCAAPPTPDGPPVEVQIPLETGVLANGLTVAVAPNHGAPIVTAMLAVRAGASVEDTATAGQHHLLEHLVLSASAPVPDGSSFRSSLQALGATFNGRTSSDSVRYSFTAGRAQTERALGLLAHVVRHPNVSAAALEREKKVVLDEANLRNSTAESRLQRRLLAELYGDDGLRFDALGTRDAVLAATPEGLLAMHATYYVPEQALLVLSGDLTVEEGLALAETHLGDWRRADGAMRSALVGGPLVPVTDRRSVVQDGVRMAEILVAWRGPDSMTDPELDTAGDVLSAITLETDHAFRSLVDGDAANGAGLSLYRMRKAGFFVVSLTVRAERVRPVLEQLRSVMAQLGRPGDVTREQLAAAKDRLYQQHVLDSTDPTTLPEWLTTFFWSGASVERFGSYADTLYAVDRDDVARVAERYLRAAPNAIVVTTDAEGAREIGAGIAW